MHLPFCSPILHATELQYMAGHINIPHNDIHSATSTASHTSTSSSTSTSTSTSTAPKPSHFNSLHDHDHELSTPASAASSSSCDGGALLDHLEEGQGESSCDHSASNSSKSRTHDLAGYGECPCDTDMVWRGSHPAAAVVNHRSSCFCKDIEQEQEYFQQILGSSSYGWTDKKHSSYLDSMEADFLRSVMFRGNAHEEPSSELSDSASSQQAKSSKEFKVCQNGRWRPKSVHASYVGPLAQVAVAVKNPWIKRFRSPSKPKGSPNLVLQDPLLQVAMDSRRWRQEHI